VFRSVCEDYSTPAEIEKAIRPQVDFCVKLMDRVASLAIKETRVKEVDQGLFTVTTYLTNPGWLPTSTSQGREP